jgi:hypothetical protein
MAKQLKEEQSIVQQKEEELSKWKAEKEEVSKMEVGDEGEWADGKVYVMSTLTIPLPETWVPKRRC